MLVRVLLTLLVALMSTGCEKLTDIGGINSFPPDNLNYSCNYFVDAEKGNDLNEGTSQDKAWQTLGQVSKTSGEVGFVAGDAVCFKRGQRFLVIVNGKGNGDLAAGSRASAAQPVFYGAYGDEALPRPVLSPAVIIEDTADWQDLGGGVFWWPHSDRIWNASGVWEDGKWLRQAADKSLTGGGKWFYQNKEGLYFRPSNGVVTGHQIHFAQAYAIFGVHQLTNTVFIDLAFEYAGSGLNGSVLKPQNRGPAGGMFNVAVINSTFKNIVIPIDIRSETYNGIVYEAHNLAFVGNTFSDMRYGILLRNSTNGPEGFYNILIKDNVMRNLAIDGAYMWPEAIDVEGIGTQNIRNAEISNNDIRTGVKSSDPQRDKNGNPLLSNGIVIWRHPEAALRNVLITNNFLSDLDRGIAIGTGIVDAMRNIEVSNNIVANSVYGLRINGVGANKTYVVAHNAMYRNNVNAQLSPIGGSVYVGNLSVDPVEYHIEIPSASRVSVPDYNSYIPDGNFRVAGNSAKIFKGLAEWKVEGYDANSLSSTIYPFVSSVPVDPSDFMLSAAAQILDNVNVDLSNIKLDFGGRQRVVNTLGDNGAWERQITDP